MAALLLLSACSGSEGQNGQGGQGKPVEVGYVVIQPSSVLVQETLPGRVAAFQISEVRPQVSGVILRRLFAEGSVVRQGQTLYQIDPSVYAYATAAEALYIAQSIEKNAVHDQALDKFPQQEKT